MMKNYKTPEKMELFRQNVLFTVKKGDRAEFYFVPLQGLELLNKINIKHLSLVIRSKSDSSKFMSMGFYPTDGNVLGALLMPKKGFLWSPDPHYIPTVKGFKPAYYHKTNIPVVYSVDAEQATILNVILSDNKCKLKDGAKSRGMIKRDRLECPVEQFRYSPLPKKGCKNCVTWLYTIFPNLRKDIKTDT
jgi:hypothetical protein